MIIIWIIFVIIIKYVFEFFSDKYIEQQSKLEPKTTFDIEKLFGTVRAKDRTYNRTLRCYEYATRIVFDNGYAHTFSSYNTYMNCYPGQRVSINCYVTLDENKNIIKRSFMDFDL